MADVTFLETLQVNCNSSPAHAHCTDDTAYIAPHEEHCNTVNWKPALKSCRSLAEPHLLKHLLLRRRPGVLDYVQLQLDIYPASFQPQDILKVFWEQIKQFRA